MYKTMGEATGAELVLEAVVACREPDGSPCGDEATMRTDLARIRDAVAAAGVRFARVAVAPAADLKCTLPGSVWPACPRPRRSTRRRARRSRACRSAAACSPISPS